MVCYHPIQVCFPAVKNLEDKRYMIFSEQWCKDNGYKIFNDSPIIRDAVDYSLIHGFKATVPCGKCIGCRLDYSRRWATRALHESSLYGSNNTFVTLTFDDEHLPLDRSVNKAYLSSWLKRFRKKFGEGIRYMACGEYGTQKGRPHYHILFFNFKFPDQKFWTTRRGQVYYRSQMLEDVWREPYSSESNGFSVIGDVTFESSAYVARYITKKLDGPPAYEKYLNKHKEFLSVSRMPGLGSGYVEKYYKDIFNNGFVLIGDSEHHYKAPIPRYYWDQLKLIDPYLYECKKLDKFHEMVNNLFIEDINSTQERLQAREELQKMKLDKLVRTYEFNGNLHNI